MKSKKTLIIYTSSDFPYGVAPENFVRQMAFGLKINDVDLVICRIKGRYYSYQNDTGIKCTNLVYSWWPKNEFFKFLGIIFIIFVIPVSVLKNYIKYKPTALILYGIEYFYFVLPFWILSRLLGIKVIRIITDLYSRNILSPYWWKRPKIFFYNIQFKYFDRFLNGVVCLSSYLEQIAVKYNVKKNRIEIIPHFIDVEGFSKNIFSLKINQNIKIGFCGHVSRENGIYDLIDAFIILIKHNKNIELQIIGEPSSDDQLKIINKLGDYKDMISVTGFLDKDSVKIALDSCDILINPRKSGVLAEAGFPTKLGEYFAMKKPIVSTKTGDIKYYFENKKELILVEPDDPTSLANGINYLIQNRDKAKQIAEEGYLWALENLDFIKNSSKLIKFLDRI